MYFFSFGLAYGLHTWILRSVSPYLRVPIYAFLICWATVTHAGAHTVLNWAQINHVSTPYLVDFVHFIDQDLNPEIRAFVDGIWDKLIDFKKLY